MLSGKEKEGLKAILEKLDNHNLVSLSGTITKGMIKPETKDEAINVILMCSENAFSLLNRRKIKKEILFHYLKDNNVVPTSTADKATYVTKCLKLWESNVDYENIYEMDDVEDEETNHISSATPHHNDNSAIGLVNLRQQTTTEISVQLQAPLETAPVTSDLERMGREFAAWYYNLLNNVNTEPAEFHSDHFWPDCQMKLQISGTNMQLQQLGVENALQVCNGFFTEQVLGAENVSDKLIRFVTMGRLFFHPNTLLNGISTVMERHGLVKIIVSGVLHNENHCVGLFDQTFGLIRSANSEDNWRIKYIELLLKLKHPYLMVS